MWLEQSRQRKGAGDRVTGKDVTLLGTLRTRAWTLRAPGSGGLSRQILRFDSGRSQSCWPGSGPVKWTAGGKQLQWEELGACCPRLWQTAGSPDGRMWMRREGSGTCELEDRSEVRGDGAHGETALPCSNAAQTKGRWSAPRRAAPGRILLEAPKDVDTDVSQHPDTDSRPVANRSVGVRFACHHCCLLPGTALTVQGTSSCWVLVCPRGQNQTLCLASLVNASADFDFPSSSPPTAQMANTRSSVGFRGEFQHSYQKIL